MNFIYVTIIMPLYKIEFTWFCNHVHCEQRQSNILCDWHEKFQHATSIKFIETEVFWVTKRCSTFRTFPELPLRRQKKNLYRNYGNKLPQSMASYTTQL